MLVDVPVIGRDHDLRRRQLAGREAPLQHFEPAPRVGVRGEALQEVEARLDRRYTEGAHNQDHYGSTEHHTGAARNHRGHPAPEGTRLARTLLRVHGPERCPAEQHGQGRDQRQPDQQHDEDGRRQHGAKRLERSVSRQQECYHRYHRSSGAGGDGRSDLAHGHPDGCPAGRLPTPFLTVPRHNEQREVRTGAEHQHGHHSRRLTVQREAELVRQQCRHGLGDEQRPAHADDGQDGEQRRPIDGEEDHKHENHGGKRDPEVNALEHPRGVGRDAGRPGHGSIQAGAGDGLLGLLPNPVYGLAESLLRRGANDCQEEHHRPVVRGDERLLSLGCRKHRADGCNRVRCGLGAQYAVQPLDGRQFLRGERLRATDHEDGRNPLGRRELVGDDLDSAQRLGAGRQKILLLVGRYLAQGGRHRLNSEGYDQPE